MIIRNLRKSWKKAMNFDFIDKGKYDPKKILSDSTKS